MLFDRHVNNGAVIARSSQPEVGWLGWRSAEDEDLLKALADACSYDKGESTMVDSSIIYPDNSDDGVAGNSTKVSIEDLSKLFDCLKEKQFSFIGDSMKRNFECVLKLLNIFFRIVTHYLQKVLIVDARSYTTAVANRARGGGCECPEYYPSCDIQFMNLPNIHSIRKSFHAVRQLCASDADQPK